MIYKYTFLTFLWHFPFQSSPIPASPPSIHPSFLSVSFHLNMGLFLLMMTTILSTMASFNMSTFLGAPVGLHPQPSYMYLGGNGVKQTHIYINSIYEAARMYITLAALAIQHATRKCKYIQTGLFRKDTNLISKNVLPPRFLVKYTAHHHKGVLTK